MKNTKNLNRVERLFGTRVEGVYTISGIVHMIRNEAELPYVREGEIIVADRIDSEWRDQLRLAKAIIENADAPDSVAEKISQQYSLPGVINVPGAMELRSGDIITIYGDGEIERVFEKRAPDSPMRVSVPAAVSARNGHGIIAAENVVSFNGAKAKQNQELTDDQGSNEISVDSAE